MIFWYLLTLDIFSNKLIIGEEWNSQLIFPSVSQELKPRHAAPLNTSSSWVIFILILERRDPILWVLWDNTYHVRLWGSAPAILPHQAATWASSALPVSGAASTTPTLIQADEQAPTPPPPRQDPRAPAMTHIHMKPPSGAVPSPRCSTTCGCHQRRSPCPLPLNPSSWELASLGNLLFFIYRVKETVRITAHFDMLVP